MLIITVCIVIIAPSYSYLLCRWSRTWLFPPPTFYLVLLISALLALAK